MKKSRVSNSVGEVQTEMDKVAEHLKDADFARIDMEKRRLDFKRERLAIDRDDRPKEHDNRKENVKRSAERDARISRKTVESAAMNENKTKKWSLKMFFL